MSCLAIWLILYVHLCRSISTDTNTNIIEIIICEQLENDDFRFISLL